MKPNCSFQKQRYALSPNEGAFTLIEALLSLSIFTLIVTFTIPVFQIMLINIDSHTSVQEMEWEVFCSQIKKEIRMCSHAEIVSGRLFLTKDADTVIYEQYGSNIRRRVNSTGHEIILQNVANVTFSLFNNSVKINVTDIWAHDYSLIAFSLFQWNVNI